MFEVSIGSKQYMLKMFKFYDDEEDRAGLVDQENDNVSVDLLRAHMDPFFNECRAYGRLIEAGQNWQIAVHCHGHMSIPAGKVEELGLKFGIHTWDQSEENCAKPLSERQPLRAVVKDLIREPMPVTQKVVKKMLNDLKAMRELGVYPMDVRARDYEAGLLKDMSAAMTTPHYLFEIRPNWQVLVFQREDLLMFDQMIKDEGVKTWVRALPDKEFCAKLRSRSKRDQVLEKRR